MPVIKNRFNKPVDAVTLPPKMPGIFPMVVPESQIKRDFVSSPASPYTPFERPDNLEPYNYLNPTYPLPEVPIQQGGPYFPPNAAYPGALYGAPFEDVQALIKKQKKAAGFNFIAAAGSAVGVRTFRQINLSSSAHILLGFRIGNQVALLDQRTSFTLTVNNEIIVEEVSQRFFTNDWAANSSANDYISLPRPLSGVDNILLVVNSFDAGTVAYDLIFYYL